ncbi:pyruvate ferredoxin oxidoreductase [candidate division WOR-1 bacterium RIFOXYB2_FULL_42_35]|uniref:Pyruvate ferredoxin oxidoreductase n=1 Tax=candidate division WOR-1 bacterium RIFOXYC2_FULL_41_25 TaxID=1802586 RepID=A0A1F4TIX5_UNCSA|nr:MAG: pyruvate ferredoxin oxidoreductase [candidate division WOR-1 bacterium RIFOXYA2_FULL_41_14]OGC21631.1 MAG: pyruvate ferredoxin oxidoreductase [candidate division WOR-1 bacterium RIFOXYB2_FULL_42_35]OGC32634.1 MAG: pyruvate ferredoxin oxidoreductase [candidate division WOR-1 bacterium RIFOXYC2_FULL_41_25]OGC41692.1 MAG: pyruvate ferredoxin oxidoreductase [candidate division WOR-1 bacterium RIFOXYD2_FULL_41_8]
MPIIARTGNEAMSEAMRQINPDVVAAYPITPATEVVMLFAKFVADGLVDTEFVAVESEHSAMSACVGASAAGARVMTGTSSQGLQLMSEILPIASALRLPIVLCEVNRALSGPINIHCDHSDTMAVRDFAWIQIFSENAQEAYDNILQCMKIAEDKRVLLPAMATTDGFIISHCMEKIETLEDAEVKKYVGEYKGVNTVLDLKNPVTLGSLDLQDYYFEHKMPIVEAMRNAKSVIEEVGKEFGKLYGREYGLIEGYKLDDAEVAIVALGSTCGTTKAVVDELREKGQKVGLLKIRVFRPFPAEEIAAALANLKVAVILDRSDSYNNQGGPLFTEVRSALYDAAKKPLITNYIYGLGGREISLDDLRSIFAEQQEVAKAGKAKEVIKYFGVRE